MAGAPKSTRVTPKRWHLLRNRDIEVNWLMRKRTRAAMSSFRIRLSVGWRVGCPKKARTTAYPCGTIAAPSTICRVRSWRPARPS